MEHIVKILSEETSPAVFGFGNIKGFGARFVEYLSSDPARFPPCSIQVTKERLP